MSTTLPGRVFDLGGSYINYTDDRGLTWHSVRPQQPLVNGEGALNVAPNGDVLGIEWDPYSGDHLLSYKYNAQSGQWFYWEIPLEHEFFYDRPWIDVVPGPFAIGLGADTVPYVAFVQGGTGIKDPLFMSTDGLTYEHISSTTVDRTLDGNTYLEWLDPIANSVFDWIQPSKNSPITPLGGARALFGNSTILKSDLKWHRYGLPAGAPDGATPSGSLQVDSAGRVHSIRSITGGKFEYRISANGGRSWNTTVIPFPLGSLTDYKAHLAAGVAAITTRVGNQDVVYKLDIRGSSATLIRRYLIGKGDTPSQAGVTALTAPRFDFKTVGILPDGRLVTSFLDSTTFGHPPGSGMLGKLIPAMAFELDTSLPPLKPDLAAGAISLSAQKVSGADQVTFSANVQNIGPGSASGVAVRFLVDDVQLGAQRTIASLASGVSSSVSSDAWSAKHQAAGAHTVKVVIDPTNAIVETDEANNSATGSFQVQANKVQNGSFEQTSNGSSPDGWTTSGQTSYESGGSDGIKSAGAGPGGSWTSAPVTVVPGTSYRASVDAIGAGGTLLVQQLSSTGTVLATSSLTLVPTTLFGQVSLPVTTGAGAAQVRVALLGGLTGATRFDDVWLTES